MYFKVHFEMFWFPFYSSKDMNHFIERNMVNRNNAGVMYCPFALSQDGIEMQFATNHVGN